MTEEMAENVRIEAKDEKLMEYVCAQLNPNTVKKKQNT